MEFITSQKKLAERVGCTEVHISKIKSRRYGLSQSLAERLAKETGISAFTWAAGPKLSLKKQLREFFEGQMFAELMTSRKGRK